MLCCGEGCRGISQNRQGAPSKCQGESASLQLTTPDKYCHKSYIAELTIAFCDLSFIVLSVGHCARGLTVYARRLKAYTHCCLVDAWRAKLALTNFLLALQFLLEGQEEIGSPNLAELLQENRNLLRADIALSADGGQISPKHVSHASLAADPRDTL